MKLEANISSILLKDWDPIGVKGIHHSEREYDQYAMRIFGMLHRGAKVADIAAYLLSVERDEFGLRGNERSANEVAEKLSLLSLSEV